MAGALQGPVTGRNGRGAVPIVSHLHRCPSLIECKGMPAETNYRQVRVIYGCTLPLCYLLLRSGGRRDVVTG